MQCTNLPVEKYRFLNLFQGGAGRARKFPDFLSHWPNSQYYLNYLYSNIYQNIPLFKHKVHPGLITNLLWSPRLSYKYDTNILHEIRYSRQRWASLYRTRKNILLRSLQMCFLPSRLFPEFEIVLFHNSTQFTEFPSPAQRAACRLTRNADRPI